MLLSLPSYSESVAPSSLPPFDASRTYQVPGATLEQFRLGLITLDSQLKLADIQLSQASAQLKDLQGSFKAYRTQTAVTEIALGALATGLLVLAILK